MDREAREQGKDAIPAEQVVINAPANQTQHLPERFVVGSDGGLRYSHDPTELSVHFLIRAACKGEGQRGGHAAVALRNVAVVPNVEAPVRIAHGGKRSN